MKPFMDSDFLLSSQTAQNLYHNYAEKLPIIDYHCHVDPAEIFQDRRFENIYQIWLEADHYKWRVMRSNGIDERYITGDAPEREKFQKFAETLPKAIGNPMYHWCHMELKTYFGYEGILNGQTAEEVWNLSVHKLAEEGMSARGIIKQSGVAFVGTTDDPTDSLIWHKKIKDDPSIDAVVAPSFRPDKALNIEKPDWLSYIAALSEVSGIEITDLSSLEQALSQRLEVFEDAGCRAADHGLDYVPFVSASRDLVNQTMLTALNGLPVSLSETEAFKTYLLQFCAAKYAEMGWVLQIHFNCVRNPNSKMLAAIGPDRGFDCISNKAESIPALYALLDSLYRTDALPRTVLYSLNPTDNAVLGTMIGAFQGTEAAGKLQHGSAWWFNDNKIGMTEQLSSLANLSLLGNFIGMLTDSRSFLSYTRHAYFRRILCEFIGNLVENGEYPADMETLGSLVSDICFYNAHRYFGLA